MSSKSLVDQLNNGLTFLFLGQKYLSLDTGTDVFLKDILQKYSNDNGGTSDGYHAILKLKLEEKKETVIGWLNNRCDRISAPEWLKTLAKYPWNGVYTTAIDTLWYKTFRLEWRTVTPIYDRKYNPSDIRSRTNLHGTYLFGSIGADNEYMPPFTKQEWRKKKLNSSPILVKLKEVVTPLGVLLVEGYSLDKDWLSFEEFNPVIDSFNKQQVHFFSVSSDFFDNEEFKALVDSEKIVPHAESLASFLLSNAEQGLIKLNEKPEDYGEHTIKTHGKILTVPLDLWNQVSKSSLILEDELFHLLDESLDTRYFNFLTFLHNSSNIPVWNGYPKGFAFQRAYEISLWNKSKYALDNVDKINEPFILYGQSGTGKTIALGRISYEARKIGYPVLFIERKSTRPSVIDIDEFCKWAEDNGSNAVLVVWDGMEEPDLYYQTLRYLLGRGRKVLLIGSSYKNDKINATHKNNFIEAPSFIDDEEKQKLSAFLKSIDTDINLEKIIGKTKQDSTFFVALYRLLPPTRIQLRQNLNAEVVQAEEKIINATTDNPLVPTTTLGIALYNAGFRPNSSTFTGIIQQIEGEDINFVKKLIGLIMVPGRFGLKVPFSLLLRALKTEWMEQLVDYLQQDIFRWDEDKLGQISIGARHPLEAQIIVDYRFGNASAEVSFVKDLLLEVQDTENSDSPDIQFAVDLLRSLGPNGRQWDHFAPLSLKLFEILEALREEIGINNSRLMLQEASLIRESVIWHTRKSIPLDNSMKLLSKAENILRHALKIVDPKNIRLRNVISVELSTLLATKTKQFLDQNQMDDSTVKLFWQTREELAKSIGNNPEDYHPVDVLSWFSLEALKRHFLKEEENIEVRADLLDVLFSSDGEGYDPEQYQKFLERRLEIAEFFKDEKLSNETFASLATQGSKAGYYLRAIQPINKIMLSESFNEGQIELFKEVAAYLETNRHNISGDGRCLRLLLKSWWISKVHKPMFSGERQTTPLSSSDWLYVWNLTNEILSTNERFATILIRYIHGVSLFHLGRVDECLQIFKEIERQSEGVQGRKRIVRSYLVSDPTGKPKEFNGQVVWINDKGDRGEVFVEELRSKIPFIPFDFYSGRELRKNDPLPKFHIAFNFIGPIIDSIKYYSRK